MSLSRILGGIGLIGLAVGALGNAFEYFKPGLGYTLITIGALLTAFNERIQGGKSKVE